MKKILILGMLIATLFSTTSCVLQETTVSGLELKLNNQKQGFENSNFTTREVSIAFPDYNINGHIEKPFEEDAETYKSNIFPLNALPKEYTYDLAKDFRNVVISPDELIYNLEEINNFMTHTQMGIKDYIRIAIFDEIGIPILMDLEYDGFIIVLTVDKSRIATETDEVEKTLYDKITLEVKKNQENGNNIINYILSSDDNDHKRVLFKLPENTP